MRLLEAVAGRQYGATAKQLAREVGLALPTAYHLLRTLTHEGYLRRDKGLFFLGEAAEQLSARATQQKRRSTVDDALAQWRDSVGVPVYYAVYREGEIEVHGVADYLGAPAVEEWADFRETGHTTRSASACCSNSTRRPAESISTATPFGRSRPTPSMTSACSSADCSTCGTRNP